jgi:hypothetical protein
LAATLFGGAVAGGLAAAFVAGAGGATRLGPALLAGGPAAAGGADGGAAAGLTAGAAAFAAAGTTSACLHARQWADRPAIASGTLYAFWHFGQENSIMRVPGITGSQADRSQTAM